MKRGTKRYLLNRRKVLFPTMEDLHENKQTKHITKLMLICF